MSEDVASPVADFEELTDEELRRARRLAAIQRWRVLDAPPDAFKPMTTLAAKIYGVPFGTVCVVESETTWFKDTYGLTVDPIPTSPGLCCSVVETGQAMFLPDARSHPESGQHPLVTGDFGLRFYAGVPLRMADGYHVGTLAVFDQQRREVTDEQRTMHLELAEMVVRELEVRLAARMEVTAEKEEAEAERAKAANLENALGSHGLIGQAMGILMAQRRYTSDDAFAALRHVSQLRNVKLVDVARSLVDDVDQRNKTNGARVGP